MLPICITFAEYAIVNKIS